MQNLQPTRKEGISYQWSVAIDDFMPSSPFGASSLHRLDPLPRSCAAQASPECLKARHEYRQHKHTEKPSCVKNDFDCEKYECTVIEFHCPGLSIGSLPDDLTILV